MSIFIDENTVHSRLKKSKKFKIFFVTVGIKSYEPKN